MGLCEEVEHTPALQGCALGHGRALNSRRMEVGPGAFGWSPATRGTMLAAGPQPLPLVRPTALAGTRGEAEPQHCQSISERGQGILGWRPNE